MTKRANRSVVTGVNLAYVNLPDGRVVDVAEGREIPASATDEERDRLAGLGVFGEHRRVGVQRRLNDLVRAGLAQVAALAPSLSDEPDDDAHGEELTPIEPALDSRTVAELKQIAEDRGIDLDGAKLKADIITAIEAAGDREDDEPLTPIVDPDATGNEG